ncbi:tetratricopeptide repeat protein [Bacteroidota bacterium]
MKNLALITLLVLLPLVILTANSDERIKAFTKSVELETAGNYNAALKPILEIYNDNSDNYLINLRLGWLYYLAADYSNSVKYYKRALNISDNSIEAMIGITYPYSAQDNWDNVKDMYDLILEKDPMNYTANLRMGQIYFYAQEYLVARSMFEKLFDEYPSDFEVNLFLGWTNYYLGDNSTALDYFVTALIIYPNNESANEGLNLVK